MPQRKIIEVWVCPAPECPSYYAATGTPDLSEEVRQGRVEDRTEIQTEEREGYTHPVVISGGRRIVKGTRADCPDCRAMGRGDVQRVKVVTIVTLPTLDELAVAAAPRDSDAT